MTKPPGLKNYTVTHLAEAHQRSIVSMLNALQDVPPGSMCTRCGEPTTWCSMCYVCRDSCKHQWINGYIMCRNGIAAARARCLKCGDSRTLPRGSKLFDICFKDRTVEEPPRPRPSAPVIPAPMRIGIKTRYNGILFRSRLEARWAAFYDQIGWRWEYEPFDGRGYIPDFLIQGARPFLVEVKPAVTHEDYREPIEKIHRGLEGLWDRGVLILGASPFKSYESGWAGVYGYIGGYWDSEPWSFCSKCDGITIYPESHCCNVHCFTRITGVDLRGALGAAWAEATNAVQWMAAS